MRDLFLREAELLVELVVGVRLFDRVQVFALDVLDERDLQDVAVGHRLLDDDGDGRQAGLLRGAEAALAGDQAIFIVASARDDERLDDAVLADAAGQLLDRGLVEGLARLIRVRRDLLDRRCSPDRTPRRRRRRRLDGPLTGSGRRGRGRALSSGAHDRTFSARWMNSLARLT